MMRLRRARKTLDQEALASNYRQLKKICTASRVLAVVKCDAYGHGMITVSQQLARLDDMDGFAVATIMEAMVLREAGIENKILVMQGVQSPDELRFAVSHKIAFVVHSEQQLALIESNAGVGQLDIWIKVDTGMGRLGFRGVAVRQAIERVLNLAGLKDKPVLMSHFARAGDQTLSYTEKQWHAFKKILKDYPLEASIANSAACLRMPEARLQWVRSGIALYGSVPEVAAPEYQSLFQPVMTVTAELISVQQFSKGDGIGYGSRYVCPEDMQVGIAAVGYGDGYPYQARNETPVWINGTRQQLLGRVSMDMIAISLNAVDAEVGDEVELWGKHVRLQEVARCSDTLDYELATSASNILEA